MNIIAWLEFEHTYYNVAVQHVSHNAIGTHLTSNIQLQNTTDLPVFNTIYIRKKISNYKCKCTFNFWISF